MLYQLPAPFLKRSGHLAAIAGATQNVAMISSLGKIRTEGVSLSSNQNAPINEQRAKQTMR